MKSYYLKGLDCPVCAARIEEGLRGVAGVSSVSVDFGSLTMKLEASDLEAVRAAVTAMEPEVEILEGRRPSKVHAAKAGADGGCETETSSCAACSACADAGPAKAASRSRGSGLDLALLREAGILREAAFIGAAGLVAGLAFTARALATPGLAAWLVPALFGLAYVLAGRDVLAGAGRNILKGRAFDELFLMSVATIGAFAIGQYPEAVGVMVFYKIGEALQEAAAARSRASVRGLLDLRPDTARLRRDAEWVVVPAEEAAEGDLFLTLPGERVPLDGLVVSGEALVDSQALTGEPRPRRAAPGLEILAASLVLDGPLEARALRPSGESSAARMASLVEDAAHAKAKTERFITRFAKVYTPIVVGLAALLAFVPPLLGAGSLAQWAYRALVLLVISCPCALVISVPLGYFGGIGGAARRGILVKGGTVLDSLAKARTVVFDKTGTLTKGVFEVRAVEAAPGFTESEVLELAAAAEARSRHPIAASIRRAAASRGLSDGTEDEASEVREIAGRGILATVGGRRILAGNPGLLEAEGVVLPAAPTAAAADGGARTRDGAGATCDGAALAATSALAAAVRGSTVVHVASDGSFAGRIYIGDAAKEDSAAAIAALAALGVERSVVLTGDSEEAALPLAAGLGIREVHASLLPEDKLRILGEVMEETRRSGGTTIFVGDGINDAPVIAGADVGIAMGAGADVAVECADVVLMTDEPSRIAEALARARRTRLIVRENIVGSLAIKAAFLVLGALGVAVMWEAVIADVGVALLATLNATRAMGGKAS
jgi:Cd2+/Zn2+-exporting ATPase